MSFAESSNGDRWFLGREEDSGLPYVSHVANQPSGGAITRIDVPRFLNRSIGSPEQQALLRLIGTLAEEETGDKPFPELRTRTE